MGATVVGPDEGERIQLIGNVIVVKVTSEQTSGVFSAIEMRVDRGSGPPLHTHPHAETFMVQSGRLTFQAGDERIDAPAGTTVVVPGGLPHTFTNPDNEVAGALVIFSPGGFESYFRKVAAVLAQAGDGSPPMYRLRELSAEHGQEVVGPPLG